jgi:hypothetical protein
VFNGYNPNNDNLIILNGSVGSGDADEGAAFSSGPSGYTWGNLGLGDIAMGTSSNQPNFFARGYQNDDGNFQYFMAGSELALGDVVGATQDFGSAVQFGSQSQVTGTNFYVGFALNISQTLYAGTYYGWLQFQAGPQWDCFNGSGCQTSTGSVAGDFPTMLLVAGAIAMAPSAAIEVGSYYANPFGSNTGPIDSGGSAALPSGPPT